MYSTHNNNSLLDNWMRVEYNGGWQSDGSWHCPKCGTTIGKNLLGEKPFLLAWQHVQKREGKNHGKRGKP
jgi:hypothetical protein